MLAIVNFASLVLSYSRSIYLLNSKQLRKENSHGASC